MNEARRAIVFDLGGVIVRWQPLELMRQILPQHDPREAMRQIFNGFAPDAEWSAFDRGTVEPDALAERIAVRTGFDVGDLRRLIAAIPAHIEPLPDSVALLRRVKASRRCLALLSNMPRPFADHLERAHECFGWFDARVYSSRVGHIKPERAIFDHLRDAHGIDPARSVFIDDHLVNVEAARRYGWQALQFQGASHCEAALVAQRWL
jgi:putative hydrolase of the HAD superfamily